ncbi:MAG TPA: hypothetical protein VGF48_00755 [Thermoanaerobaculia bacterium]|jgi:hypothetical protein
MDCYALFTPRDARHYRIFSVWMMAAVFSFGAATILFDGAFLKPGLAAWSLTALTVGLLLMTMRAYMIFLHGADELLRKIHLESLAIAFGAGAVTMMGYRLCERLGAPKLDVNDAFLVMMLAWVAGQWVGARRYAPPTESEA